MNLFLFGFTKTKTGAKTAPWGPKLSYFDGRVPKLSSRVTLATCRWPRVVSHMTYHVKVCRKVFLLVCYNICKKIRLFESKNCGKEKKSKNTIPANLRLK